MTIVPTHPKAKLPMGLLMDLIAMASLNTKRNNKAYKNNPIRPISHIKLVAAMALVPYLLYSVYAPENIFIPAVLTFPIPNPAMSLKGSSDKI